VAPYPPVREEIGNISSNYAAVPNAAISTP